MAKIEKSNKKIRTKIEIQSKKRDPKLRIKLGAMQKIQRHGIGFVYKLKPKEASTN